MVIAAVMAPAGAVTPVDSSQLIETPLIETDVAAFTTRAEQWTQARVVFRENAHEQALALAADARQAEEDRVAAIEAERVAAEERKAAEEAARATTTTTAAPTTTATPTTTAPDQPDPAPTTTQAPADGDPTAAQWEVLRQCESSGNYSIVSANGRYRGAYQFSQATWDWIAGLDHPSLVGIDPASAAPADQDAMALALWRRRGWSPWPVCGVKASNA